MKKYYLVRLLGLYLAYVPPGGFIGNCFGPAVVLERRSKLRRPSQPAMFVLTVRSGRAGTTFYWNGGFKFWWNSAHLARRFGKFHDTAFGGYYRLGHHLDL